MENLLTVIIKKVFSFFGRRQNSAKSSSGIGVENANDDPEFNEKYYFLDLFMRVQKVLFFGSDQPNFLHSEKEKLRYLHFVIGAIDQLGQTIKDEALSEQWWTVAPMGYAVGLWGVDDALKNLESYGRSGDPELDNAGMRGAQAMRTCILNSIGEVPIHEYKISCMELWAVVRGVDSPR